jgi:dTDP-4-dehydrorhamnose 3,5-epimerase
MPVHTLLGTALIVEFSRADDGRGFFNQTYQAGELERVIGRPLRLRQGNHSRSRRHVLRGFHLEPWDKLAYVVRGTVLFAVADLRVDSETFGSVATVLLGDAPGRPARVFVPRGFANAFFCLTEVDYVNDVSEEFDPANRQGVIWNDPTLGVAWPAVEPVLSESDRRLPTLAELYRHHPRCWSDEGLIFPARKTG